MTLLKNSIDSPSEACLIRIARGLPNLDTVAFGIDVFGGTKNRKSQLIPHAVHLLGG